VLVKCCCLVPLKALRLFCSPKSVSGVPYSNMLMALKNTNSDLPPIGFCNVLLLGSKYADNKELVEKAQLVGDNCFVKDPVFKELPSKTPLLTLGQGTNCWAGAGAGI